MAYLYKGMAAVGKAGGQGDASGSVLLNWHEKVRYLRTHCRILHPTGCMVDNTGAVQAIPVSKRY